MIDEQWAREHIGITPAVEEEATGCVQSRERVAEILAGNLSDSRAGDLRDLGAYIAQLEAQVKRGGAVVVAELTGPEMFKILLMAHGGDERCVDTIPDFHKLVAFAVTEWFRENSRTVDASQVLQPGMVQVDREELMYLHAFEKYARKHGPESIQDVVGTLDHLRRAQQAKGGDDVR